MNDWSRMGEGKVNFNVGQYVRISKEKIKIAKGSEQNYTDEIFRFIKLFEGRPAPHNNWRI